MSIHDRLRAIELRIHKLELGGAGESLVVLEVPARFTEEQRRAVEADVETQLVGTNARALVLGGGAKLARPSDAALARLEQMVVDLTAKVDALIEALAQDGEGDDSEEQIDITSLDGERFVGAGARDRLEPL